jgi:hypothetical protein
MRIVPANYLGGVRLSLHAPYHWRTPMLDLDIDTGIATEEHCKSASSSVHISVKRILIRN